MPALAERYELGDVLYSDADVVAYRGHDRLLDRAVTVEMLQAQHVGNPGFVDRLVEKARNAALVSLPNVAALYDQNVVDGRPFLVLEEIAGPALSEAGPLSAEHAVELLCALSTTVQTALSRQQMVPTLTEHTVRVGSEGRFQVLDLGLQREVPNPQQIKVNLGQILSTAVTGSPDGGDITPLQQIVQQTLSGGCSSSSTLIAQVRTIQDRANQATTVLRRVPPTVVIPDEAVQHGRAKAGVVQPKPAIAGDTSALPSRRKIPVWAIAAAGGLLLLLALGSTLFRGGEDTTRPPTASSGASGAASTPANNAAASIPAGVRYVVAARGSSTVRVRSGPGTGAPQVGSLPNGTVVEVISDPQPADGYRWVQIRADGITGWCISEALRKE